jgi:cytochrome d ubiquinol oxidase subunit I
VVAFYITTAFVVLAVAAYYLRAKRHPEESRVMFYQALGLLTILVPLQIFIGDAQGLNTLKYQPAKLAAIEARWDTQSHFPLTLFAIPDEQTVTNRHALDIPDLGSLILTQDPNGTVRGLKSFPRDEWPPVIYPFFAFRIMVGIGVLMLALVIGAWIMRLSGRLLRARGFLRLCELASPLDFLAVLAGWTTTEVGRQPWTVYGLLRTADSVSPSLTPANVIVSLIGYGVVYLVMYPVACGTCCGSSSAGPRSLQYGPGLSKADGPSILCKHFPMMRRLIRPAERSHEPSHAGSRAALGADPCGRHLLLRGVRRLRSRRGHPLRPGPGCLLAQPHHELHCAGLGRE